MGKITTTYRLDLSFEEGCALKKLLGTMTDDEFKSHGIEGEERAMMSDLWDMLPYDDD